MKNDISVIIPFYNAEHTLLRAVSSVLNQINPSWEVILVNDGSSDCSEQVAENFINDPRIQYFRQENKGVSTARNLGANKAKTNWLIFLDADDELSLDALSIYQNAIAEFPGRSVLLAGLKKITGNSIITHIPQKGKFKSKIPGTFCLEKELFDEVGGYDEQMKYSENTELFHRIELLNKPFGYIQKVTVNYHDTPDGGSKNLKNMISSLSWFLDKHPETLSPHVKHLFNQIIGVNYLRFGENEKAKLRFKASLKYEFKIPTLLRYIISFSEVVSSIIYSK